MLGPTRYPAAQLAWARAGLGLYLAVFFAWLAPHADGLLALRADEALRVAARDPFAALAASTGAAPPLLALAALALGFAAGWARRPLAVALGCGYACVLAALPLGAVPQAPFVGWLLWASLLVPPGEGALGRPARADWRMPLAFPVAAWIVLAVAYTASGISKLASPSFVDGDALAQIFTSPIGRRWAFNDLLLAWPPLLQALTWASLALELAFAPLCLAARTRALAWWAMSGMHVGIALTLGIADVPIGMLVYHAFVFDVAWLPARLRDSARSHDGRAHGGLADLPDPAVVQEVQHVRDRDVDPDDLEAPIRVDPQPVRRDV